jgi:diguanylate cyclase (GGDEF)-like protein/PAS domain S-box-containing protein
MAQTGFRVVQPIAELLAADLDRQQHLLDALPDLLVRIDAQGRCNYVNRTWLEFTGRAPRIANDDGWLVDMHPEDVPRCTELLREAVASRRPFQLEYRLRRANGEYGWLIHQGIPLADASGAFGGFLGVCHDITEQKQAELAAHSRESEIRLLANSLPVLIAYAEINEQRYTFANKAYAHTYGWTEQTILGRTVREVIGEEAYQLISPHVEAVINGKTVNYERPIISPDGEQRFIEVDLIPHFNDGTQLGAFIVINDITKHRLAEQAVRESEERLRKFAAATNDGILFQENGIVVDCNETICNMFGYELAELKGHHLFEFMAPESWDLTMHHIRTRYEKPYEIQGLHKDGRKIPLEVVGKEMPYQGGTTRMSIVRDITDRKRAEARIQFMAHHDSLTLLPNRANLMERLELMLSASRRKQTFVAMMFIDLDHFKTVNDSLGHHAGDALLKIIAGRLKSCLRDADTVARLGGDEFLVVVPDLREPQAVGQVADKIIEVVSESCTIEGQTLSISPSIGISIFPRDGNSPDDLIKNADAAMYLAKEHGRSNYQFFTPRLNNLAFEALSIESSLRDAIRQNEFVLHYQPQSRIEGGQIVATEAVIRWQHPDEGLVMPEKFIGVAEQRGLIIPIGAWVLEEACRQNVAWQAEGLPPIPVVVNLSAVQFKRRDLVQDVAQVLQKTGLDGRYLELEVTESVLMEDVSTVTNTLMALRDIGVKIAIDDFGTGYSSLSYLKRFPIDKLKIDRSFIRDLPQDSDDLAITGAIISMAQSLKIKTLAEGVETAEQFALLRERGCDEIQGYYLSRPLPAEALAQFLRSRMTPGKRQA